MPRAAACPDLSQYQRLAADQLPDAEAESLLAHLQGCEACAQKLSSLPEPDTLASLLRQAPTLTDAAAGRAVARLVEALSKLRPDVAPVAKVKFPCPFCGKGLRARPENAGKKFKCPHCGKPVRAPAASAPAQQALESALTLAGTPLPEGQEHTEAARPSELERSRYAFLAPPQAPDELGRLGPYRVLAVLGAGGMGVVFRAEDPQLQRPVALKAMLPALADSASARQRFLREARAAAALKHDHIVGVYQVSEDGGVPYLAMEFLNGEPLDERLQREGKLPLAEVLRIGREIALGLAAAHERGLIHRDIKPANIWLEAGEPGASATGGRVKILDFGLARATGVESQLTQQGVIIGTPAYMAPEQAQGKEVDPRCDLFSLGCVLYRMATGAPPFRGSDMISTLLAVATEMPRPPHALEAGLPPALSQLIMNLLAKEAARRPASARAVAETLEHLAADLGNRVPSDRPAAQKKWPRAAGVAAGLVLAGLVLLWAGGVFRLQTRDGTIVLAGLPPGAEVSVEGETARVRLDPQGQWLEVRGAPGEHKLHIKASGFEARTQAVTLQLGVNKPLDLRLEPLAAAPSPTAPPTARIDPGLRRAFMSRSGDWRIEGTELVQETMLSDCQLVFGDFTWKDYDFTVEARKVGELAEIVLLYHTTGSGYGLVSAPGKVHGNIQFASSVERGIHLHLKRSAGTLERDRWYKLGIRLRGTHCQCFRDDELVLDYEDQRNPQGAVGLWTSYGAVRFRNIRVTDPAGKVLFQGLPQLPAGAGQWLPATEPAAAGELACLKGHNSPVTGLTFSHDGRQILSCSDGETMGANLRQGPVRWYSPASSIRLWDAATAKELHAVSVDGARGFLKLAAARDTLHLVSHIRDHTQVGLWSLAGGKIQSLSTLPATGLSPPGPQYNSNGSLDLAFTPDGRRALGLSRNTGALWEWDVADRILLRRLPGTLREVTCTAITPDARHALLARRNEPLAELDLSTGKETGRWKQAVGVIRSLAIAPDRSRVLTGGEDGTLRLWDLASATHLAMIGTHPRPVLAVALSPDGRRALTGGDDQTVRLWDLESKRELASFPGHTGAVLTVAFAPDGQRAVSGSADYTIRLWRLPQ